MSALAPSSLRVMDICLPSNREVFQSSLDRWLTLVKDSDTTALIKHLKVTKGDVAAALDDRGRIQGLASYHILDGSCSIGLMVTHPPGRGTGTALLQFFASKSSSIELSAMSSAVPFYVKKGFVQSSKKPLGSSTYMILSDFSHLGAPRISIIPKEIALPFFVVAPIVAAKGKIAEILRLWEERARELAKDPEERTAALASTVVTLHMSLSLDKGEVIAVVDLAHRVQALALYSLTSTACSLRLLATNPENLNLKKRLIKGAGTAALQYLVSKSPLICVIAKNTSLPFYIKRGFVTVSSEESAITTSMELETARFVPGVPPLTADESEIDF